MSDPRGRRIPNEPINPLIDDEDVDDLDDEVIDDAFDDDSEDGNGDAHDGDGDVSIETACRRRRAAAAALTIRPDGTFVLTRAVCRVCGCTDEHGCVGG